MVQWPQCYLRVDVVRNERPDLEAKKDVEDLMARTISEKQVELEGLEKSRTYVLKKREECEGQIRELLSSTPDLARAIAAASR